MTTQILVNSPLCSPVPLSIVRSRALSRLQEHLFGVLNNLALKNKYIKMTDKYLAEILNCTIKTIQRAYLKFRRLGLISTHMEGRNRITTVLRTEAIFPTTKLSRVNHGHSSPNHGHLRPNDTNRYDVRSNVFTSTSASASETAVETTPTPYLGGHIAEADLSPRQMSSLLNQAHPYPEGAEKAHKSVMRAMNNRPTMEMFSCIMAALVLEKRKWCGRSQEWTPTFSRFCKDAIWTAPKHNSEIGKAKMKPKAELPEIKTKPPMPYEGLQKERGANKLVIENKNSATKDSRTLFGRIAARVAHYNETEELID